MVKQFTKLSQARMKLYNDSRVQLLFGVLIDQQIDRLTPWLDSGKIARFPIAENVLNESPLEILRLLESAAHVGLLHKRFYQKQVCCPKCKSAGQIFIRYFCAKCNSVNLRFYRLARHLHCGKIFYLEETKECNQPICPYCKSTLVGDGDYIILSTKAVCDDCGSSTLELIQTYFCSECKNEFLFSNAHIKNLYSYTLNQRFIKELRNDLILLIIKKILTGYGFIVQMPGYVIGASGVQHNFTLLATYKRNTITIDFLISKQPIDISMILPIYIKILDTNPIKSIIITSSELTSEAQSLCNSAGLIVILGKPQELLKKALDKILEITGINDNYKGGNKI